MTILYIAGPMTGIAEYNYPAFHRAGFVLREAGYEVLNPLDIEDHNDTGEHQAWDWYMRHSLRMVTLAEGVALLDGWYASSGAMLEVNIAHALKLPIRKLNEWLDQTFRDPIREG